jgi:stearoyl-CoA desaturase (delta-9 desaturase)
MWQEKHYFLLGIASGFLLPTLIGACFGQAWGGFVWGGAVRMVVVHQVTFMINSVAHSFGRKTYSQESTARDNPLLAVFTFGEGYHSFHHAHAGDYRIGAKWYHFDPGKWLIQFLSRLRLATRLKRAAHGLVDPASNFKERATA